MFKKIQVLIGFTVLGVALSAASLPNATAQIGQQERSQATSDHSTLAQRSTQSDFQGRGVAQGATFTKGRSADVSLIVDGDNFGLEISEPLRSTRGSDLGSRAQVQYRGAIIRQRNSDSSSSSSFTLDGRVRSFNSSANLRVLPNTTGTCRIEVFDSRVISSTCNSVASDSSIRFLGLEQF